MGLFNWFTDRGLKPASLQNEVDMLQGEVNQNLIKSIKSLSERMDVIERVILDNARRNRVASVEKWREGQ